MQHLEEGTIHAWLDGALSAEQAADVERHVRECAECAALVADARGVIAGAARIVSALDDVPGGVIPKAQAPAAPRSLWRALHLTPLRAALAASLMVAAASLAVVRYAALDERTLQPGSSAKLASSPAVVAAPAPVAPAAPTSDKNLETALRRSRADVAKQSRPADEPRGLVQAKSEIPVAATRAKAITLVDSVSSRVAGGVAKSIDSTRPSSSGDAPRRESQQVVAAAPPPPSASPGNAGAAGRAMSGVGRDAARLSDAVLTGSFSLVLTSADDRPLALPGCYQLVRDSVGSPTRLPDRFSLESSTEPVRRNIVRALTQDGRRDSVIAGITWQPAPGADHFVLIRSVAPASAAFKEDAMNRIGPSGLANAATVRLSRLDCR
jgi:hypothetical protein